MRKPLIFLAALTVTGCASAYPVGDYYTADLREAAENAAATAPSLAQVLLGAAADFLIETNPNRTETVVYVGRDRHVVTTSVSRDGRRGSVRVSP